jgi:hypothetical protein
MDEANLPQGLSPRSAQSAQSERACRSSAADIVFVNRIAVVRHVIDAQCNEVTATQFAVNGEIEHCQVARAFLQIQPGAYRPYVTGSQGRLWASDLPLFQVDQGTLAAELVSVIVGLLR